MTEEFDVVIVGGGHNGLVASWYLAREGLKVAVFEARGLVGGACVTEELWPGFRFSTYAMYCNMLQETVSTDLELVRHGLEVIHLDPYAVSLFPNGNVIRHWGDFPTFLQEIGRISPADASAYPRFRRFQEAVARIIHTHFMTDPPSLADLVDATRGSADAGVLEQLLTRSVTDVVNEYFESDEVKATLATAGDVGDPDAPGSLLCLGYLWHSMLTAPENVGIVRGGMGEITKAMASAAAEAGVSIRLNRPVKRVLIEDGRAIGLVLEDGTTVHAKTVMSNTDPKRTLLGLTPSGSVDATTRQRIAALSTRATSLKFHATLRELPDFSAFLGNGYDPGRVAQVRICPSLDDLRQSWHDVRQGRYSRTPVLTVQIATAVDPAMAPAGRHTISVWVQYAPTRLLEGTWDELRNTVADQIIDRLAQYAPNLEAAIIDWQLITPSDMEARIGLTDGNIRHIDMSPGQFFANRPVQGWGYRTPVRSLYLCGAGTHPGGEVTGAPGHNAAQIVLADLRAGNRSVAARAV